MKNVSFKNGALRFLKSLERGAGEDLIYSIALERGQVFICVAAHPSMTKKRFSTGNERLLFLIDPTEFTKGMDDVVKDVVEQINEKIYLVGDTNEDS